MVRYKIHQGDTLGGIAKRFGFAGNYHPIWKYNAEWLEPPTLTSGNPDKIPAGATIVIPRKKDEYKAVIDKLQQLYFESQRESAKLLRELDADRKEMNEKAERFDILPKLIKPVSETVKASMKLGGRYLALVAGKHLVEIAGEVLKDQAAKSAEESKGPAAGAGASSLAAGAVEATAKSTIVLVGKGRFSPGEFLKEMAKGAAKEFAHAGNKAWVQSLSKTWVATESATLVDIACTAAVEGPWAIASVPPSFVARMALLVTGNEDPLATFQRAEEQVRSVGEASRRRITDRIKELQEEKKAIYGA